MAFTIVLPRLGVNRRALTMPLAAVAAAYLHIPLGTASHVGILTASQAGAACRRLSSVALSFAIMMGLGMVAVSCVNATDAQLEEQEANGNVRFAKGRFESVSVGDDHSCAVRSDHSVLCWGTVGHAPVPDAKFRDVAVSKGWGFRNGPDEYTCGSRRTTG